MVVEVEPFFSSFPTDCTKVVGSSVAILLSLFVRLRFHMWSLCCPYLFLICPVFDASGSVIRDCGISWVSS